MLKRAVSALLVFSFLLVYPASALATKQDELDILLSTGSNPYVFSPQKMLTEGEIEHIRQQLIAEQEIPPPPLGVNSQAVPQIENAATSAPPEPETMASPTALFPDPAKMASPTAALFSIAAFGAPLTVSTPHFKVYPIAKKDASRYRFEGLFVGGNVDNSGDFESITYKLQPGNHAEETVTTLETYKYPDSSLFSYNGYYNAQTDNWQGSSLITNLSKGQLYWYDVQIKQKNNLASPTSGDEFITTETKSESFLLYELKAGDTLVAVSNYYGVPLSTVIADNRLQDKMLSAGDTIFLRNPKTDGTIPLTKGASISGTDAAYDLGLGGNTQFTHGLVNMSTGGASFFSNEIFLDEYDGFSIMRAYNSKAKDVYSLFGYGHSSNLYIRIAEIDSNTLLFTMPDGKEIELTKSSGDTYTSWNGYYSLTKTGSGYEIEDIQRYKFVFNEYGQIIEINDKQRLPILFEYDAEQHLSAILSKSEKRFAIEMGEGGLISRINSPDGTSRQYTYDEQKRLHTVIDEDGYVTTYVYDGKGRLVEEKNALGYANFKVTYDDADRVLTYEDGEGNQSFYEYQVGKVIFTIQLSAGKQQNTIYESDARNRLTRIIHEDGLINEFDYDANDRLISYSERMSVDIITSASYTYNAQSKITNSTTDGLTTVYTYDANGNITSITDHTGLTTTYEYDSQGNNTKTIYPDGSIDIALYDSRNRLVEVMPAGQGTTSFLYTGMEPGYTKMTDPMGAETQVDYDEMGRAVSVSNEDGTTRRTYAPSGLLLSETDALGNTESYEYDPLGNQTAVIDANGNRTTTVYDRNGRVKQICDAENNWTHYEYDAKGNLIKETSDGKSKTYEYDIHGNITKETDGDGFSVGKKYDSRKRLIEETDQDGFTITYKYHDKFLDKLIEKKDKEGRIEKYEYDNNGNQTKVICPDGTELVTEYDSKNRVTSKTDERGVKYAYTYNAAGKITEESIGALGQITKYEYDANNNLIKETKTAGGVSYSTGYAYDSLNRLTKTTDANNKTISYTYDEIGQLIKEIDKDGNEKKYEYDANGNIKKTTDGNGNTISYEYDSKGKVTKEVHQGGETYAYVYDGKGNLLKRVDPYGTVISNEYNSNGKIIKYTITPKDAGEPIYQEQYILDADGNILKTVYADGSEGVCTYNKIGWPLSYTDRSGLRKSYSYDIMGRILSETDSAGRSIKYKYDGIGNLTERTDPMGNITLYEYDSFSRLVKATNPDGTCLTYAYDAFGSMVETTDVQGRKTQFAYDGLGLMKKIIRQDGMEQKFAYSGMEQLISATDERNAETKYVYDKNNNLAKNIAPSGNETAYKYNHQNRAVEEIDARGNTYQYTYDALSRLTSLSSPEGDKREYVYDVLNRISAIKDAAGNITSYTYDKMGNCLSKTDAQGNTTQYAYNLRDAVTAITYPNGSHTQYFYDPHGNMTKAVYANGMEETFEYDVLNRLVRETSASGVITSYEYDGRGNLIKISDSTGRELLFAYDQFNRLIQETNVLGGTISYEYDSFDRIVKEETDLGATKTYAYDVMGRLLQRTDERGKITEYEYDLDNRVIKITDGGREHTFSYDKNGNMLMESMPTGIARSWRYDKDNRLIAESDFKGAETVYTYDAVSNLSTITDRMGYTTHMAYDPLGNISRKATPDGAQTNYSYNVMNQLAQVQEPEGRLGQYTYDAMGSLSVSLVKAANPVLPGAAKERRTYFRYTDTNKLDAISNTAFGTQSKDGEKPKELSYSNAGMINKAAQPSGKETVYERDAMGNITSIAYLEPKQNGAIQIAAPPQQNPKKPEPTITKKYDTWGRLIDMEDKLGATRYGYDEAGALAEVKYSEGMKLNYTYNLFGEVIAIAYPDGNKVSYEGDALGQIVKLTDRDGGVTAYTYDENGNTLTTRRPDGAITTNTYDSLDRLLSAETVDAAGKRISLFVYTYDEMGRILTEESIDHENKKTKRTYTYNLLGELIAYTQITSEGKETTEYTYDALGNKTRELKTDSEGKKTTLSYEYDRWDRLLQEITNGVVSALYKYDDDGNLIEKKAGPTLTEYTYDEENRLATTSMNGVLMSSITYDGHGLKGFELLRKTYPGGSGSEWLDMAETKLVEKQVWEKTQKQELRQIAIPQDEPAPEEQLAIIIVDAAEETEKPPVQKAQEDRRSEAYWQTIKQTSTLSEQEMRAAMLKTHIPAGALASYAPPMAQILLDFAHQAWEDIVTTVDSVLMLVSEETNDSTEGATEQTKPVIVQEPWQYEEIPLGFPLEPQIADKLVTVEGLQAKYLLEPQYQEFMMILGDSGGGAYYEPTRFIFDLTKNNPEVLAEYGNSPELRTGYAYGAGGERVSALAFEEEASYYVYDGRGSVSALLQDAEVKSSYSYDPFGGMKFSEPTQDRVFGFNGEMYTPQTELQYLRARHYSPEDNRFIAQDSYLGNLTQTASQNRYAYCENDPVNYADPSGYSKSGGSSGGSSSSSSSGGGRATDAYSSGDRFASAMGLDTRSGLPSYNPYGGGMGSGNVKVVVEIKNGREVTYLLMPANKYDYGKNPSARDFTVKYAGKDYIMLPMSVREVPASTQNSTKVYGTDITMTPGQIQEFVDIRIAQIQAAIAAAEAQARARARAQAEAKRKKEEEEAKRREDEAKRREELERWGRRQEAYLRNKAIQEEAKRKEEQSRQQRDAGNKLNSVTSGSSKEDAPSWHIVKFSLNSEMEKDTSRTIYDLGGFIQVDKGGLVGRTVSSNSSNAAIELYGKSVWKEGGQLPVSLAAGINTIFIEIQNVLNSNVDANIGLGASGIEGALAASWSNKGNGGFAELGLSLAGDSSTISSYSFDATFKWGAHQNDFETYQATYYTLKIDAGLPFLVYAGANAVDQMLNGLQDVLQNGINNGLHGSPVLP